MVNLTLAGFAAAGLTLLLLPVVLPVLWMRAQRRGEAFPAGVWALRALGFVVLCMAVPSTLLAAEAGDGHVWAGLAQVFAGGAMLFTPRTWIGARNGQARPGS